MSWTLYKDILASADGTLNIGATTTRWLTIWGDTITGGVLADGTLTITGGAIAGATTITATTKIGILESGDTPTYYTYFQAGDQTGADITYTLPIALPAEDMVLQSTDAGVLSWVAATDADTITDLLTSTIVFYEGNIVSYDEEIIWLT